MKKISFVVIVAVLIALLIPFSVQAAGTFFCSASLLTGGGGSGSYTNPWNCVTQAELDYVINTLICNRYGGGVLYRIFPTSYVYYDIVWTTAQTCTIRFQAEYPGYPPRTGVNLPAPLIAALAVVGALMIGGVGFMLRRKPA